MKNNRFKLLPLVAILAAVWSGAGRADSAVGVDTLLGNAMTPGGLNLSAGADPEGYSPVMGGKGPSHTPGGQLYLYPGALPQEHETAGGAVYSGSVEAGVAAGANLNNAGFREYADYRNGVLINTFQFSAEKPAEHSFVNVRGGGIGRNDAYFGVEAGTYNAFKFSAFYNETPHVFATNAKPVWNGVGTGTLTLPAGIAPASVTEAKNAVDGNYTAFQGAVRNAPTTTLELERKKLGIKLEGYLTPTLSGFVGYTNERRQGTRPFGGGFIFDFIRWSGAAQSTPSGSSTYAAGTPGGFYASGAVMETVEPLDYTTHDLLGGLRYASGKERFNLTANVSLFRNDIKSLTWDNPFQVGFPGNNFYATGIEQGRFALAPDNDYYNLKGEYGRDIPLDGQMTAVVSLGRMRQNDDLLPPTVNEAISLYGANAAKWATTEALSQTTANARIDTQLAELGASVRPLSDFTFRGKLRFYDENNKTDYTAYNPLTGQYGYIPLDGGLAIFGGGFNSVYNPNLATQNNAIRYKNIPSSYHKFNTNLGVDYNVSSLTTASATWDREDIYRDHRERERTSEDRVKFSVNSRAIEDGTIRLSYEFANRTGSAYNYNPYEHFYVVEPVGYVHTLAQLRKSDMSDRTQQILNARFNYMLRPDMDIFLSLQHKASDNHADYGRIGTETADTANVEWNFTPSPDTSLFTFYSIQKSDLKQRNINDARATASPDAGSAYYPLSNAWDATFKDINHTLGAGFAHRFGKYRFESRYSFAWMKGKTDYAYASAAGATVGSGVSETQTAAQAGTGFNDIRFTQHILETSLVWPVDKNLGVRLLHRYERRAVSDWHYDGISEQLIGQKLYLGNSPENFSHQLLGLFLQYSL